MVLKFEIVGQLTNHMMFLSKNLLPFSCRYSWQTLSSLSDHCYGRCIRLQCEMLERMSDS